MRPTEVLMQEHRIIEQVLDCLESMTLHVEAGEPLNLDDARQAIDFFKNFADKCHHHKEEDCLFTLLEQKGFSREQGPTAVMVQEHEAGRQHVQTMAAAVEALAAGDTIATARFVSTARAFASLLREHIQKEDHCLFQMADQSLTEQEQAQLMDFFAHVEHDDLGPGTHEKYLDIAKILAIRYAVPCRVSGSTAGASCCGHH